MNLTLVPASSSVFTLSSNLSYFYEPVRHLQLGLISELALVHASSNTAVVSSHLIGPGLSIGGDDLRNDFFLRGGPGFATVSAGSSDQVFFAGGFQLGKRFEVTESISYTPNFIATFLLDGNPTLRLSLIAFQLLL